MGPRGITRRRVLQAGVAGVLAPPSTVRELLSAGREAPPGFPAGIPLARRQFENWAGSIRVNGVWTCTPRSARDVVRVVNWAHRAGWTARARGAMHGWSPLAITPDTTRATPTVLVDTSRLSRVELASRDRAAVRAGAGASMLALLDLLERHGLCLTSVPATGDPTVAGALAIGAHGAAVPGRGESPPPGACFGSLSNLVLELTAVVWDAAEGKYVLRSFSREEPDTKALLTHIGRAMITEVTLRAHAGQNLRCVSRVDIPVGELLGRAGSPGRTFESFLDAAGRVEAIWFPFTDKPWLKVWSLSPTRPASSRTVTRPYNYPFSDRIPEPAAELAARMVKMDGAYTPQFGEMMYTVVARGLEATRSADIWGAAKNTQLYIRASTLRYDELGYGVLTRRADVQRLLHTFAGHYTELLEAYRGRGSYPVNGPVELRCSGIDDPAVVGVEGAEAPPLSPMAPNRARPAWDTAVWLNILTFPGTRDAYRFYRELEQRLLASFDGSWAAPRPEWSKAWAMTNDAPCADRDLLRDRIPAMFDAGRSAQEDWAWTMERLHRFDPHHVLSNRFLDALTAP